MHKKAFKQTELGEIPEEWSIDTFSKKCHIIKGKKPKRIYSEKNEGSKPYLLVEYMSGGQQFYTDDPKIPACQATDTLLIMDGSRSGLVFTGYEGAIGSTFGAIRPADNTTDPKFVYFFLQTKYNLLQTHKTKGAIPHVDKQILKQLPMPLPSLPEQQRIASILSCVDSAIQQTDEVIEQARKLKKGLMQELLTRGIGHKKFKETEIGEVPEEWEIVNLGSEQVSSLITKGTTPTSLGFKYIENGINFIKIESIDENSSFLQNKFAHIDEETNQKLKRSILQEDDILFSIAGALGTVALVNKQILPANTNQALAIIRLNSNKILPKFIFYILNSSYVKKMIKKEESKSAQGNLSLTQINKLKIPVPSLEEQEFINAILDCGDATIQNEVQKRFQLERLKKGLMQDLLTGKVRFPEFVKGGS